MQAKMSSIGTDSNLWLVRQDNQLLKLKLAFLTRAVFLHMPDSFISDKAILLSRVLHTAVYAFFTFFKQVKSKLPQAFRAKSWKKSLYLFCCMKTVCSMLYGGLLPDIYFKDVQYNQKVGTTWLAQVGKVTSLAIWWKWNKHTCKEWQILFRKRIWT